MKFDPPRFELTRIHRDGTREAPEIVSVLRIPADTVMDRRGALGVGVGIGAVLAAFTGCKRNSRQEAERDGDTIVQPSAAGDTTLACSRAVAHQGGIRALQFSAEGNTLMSLGHEELKLWRIPDGTHLRSFPGRSELAALSPDGDTLVRYYDGAFHFRSIRRPVYEGSFAQVLGSEPSVLAFVDARTLAVGCREGRIFLFSLPDRLPQGATVPEPRELFYENDNSYGNVERFAVASHGRVLIALKAASIEFWSLADGTRYTDHGSRFALSANGEQVAIATPFHTRIVSILAEGLGPTLFALDDRSTFIAALRDGAWLSSDRGGWRALNPSGAQTRSLPLLNAAFRALNMFDTLNPFSTLNRVITVQPQGRYLAFANTSEKIQLWDLENDRSVTCLIDPSASPPEAAAVSYRQAGVVYTVPCGSPIPTGASCTCNCVAGRMRERSGGYGGGYGGGGGGGGRVCTCIPVRSDREAKRDFGIVNGAKILEGLAALPVASWRYLEEPVGVKHIGPCAQDFNAAFGVGDDPRSIAVVDALGVALAAIQELIHRLSERDRELSELRSMLQAQALRLQSLEQPEITGGR